MAQVWCEWERAEFESDQFEAYQGGPLLMHLHVVVPHLTNGIGIGPGPAPAGPAGIDAQPRGPGGWGDAVNYGHGPMARPERDE